MGPLIGLTIAALAAFVVLALWRGRLVSVALAGSECPDCRVPLVRVRDEGSRPQELPGSSWDSPPGGAGGWEIYACPDCDRVVTTVARLPSPLAECPACHQRSLVVYAEREAGVVVVDEWCDLCGRRGRTTLEAPREPAPRPTDQGGPPRRGDARILPFERNGARRDRAGRD